MTTRLALRPRPLLLMVLVLPLMALGVLAAWGSPEQEAPSAASEADGAPETDVEPVRPSPPAAPAEADDGGLGTAAAESLLQAWGVMPVALERLDPPASDDQLIYPTGSRLEPSDIEEIRFDPSLGGAMSTGLLFFAAWNDAMAGSGTVLLEEISGAQCGFCPLLVADPRLTVAPADAEGYDITHASLRVVHLDSWYHRSDPFTYVQFGVEQSVVTSAVDEAQPHWMIPTQHRLFVLTMERTGTGWVVRGVSAEDWPTRAE
ncbi:hypothetical protein [Actinotalea sp. K2]|uniref:hypothetical protein n=1 Tax=Actinotalea sp. K2 TaxID=2939438 RepID=UPI002018160E|nr:hypothetical protein [Actinotalea sp. K2]MCL3860965.1 hypothetical protein [Actinotalea sp. K2]